LLIIPMILSLTARRWIKSARAYHWRTIRFIDGEP
jgi:hypothetical protein